MSNVRRPFSAGKRIRMLVLAIVLVSVGIASAVGFLRSALAGDAQPEPGADVAVAVVERVVDGDTVIVDVDGERTRIRLLNIDTPESVDPNRPDECLGAEASAFLAELLPVGTEVRLGYDEERQDQYGRTLAAVFLGDGTLVNAEIARAGLGEAVVYGGNDRYLSAVRAAEAAATDAGVGLHSSGLDCRD
jgi:micrococcal nuclease